MHPLAHVIIAIFSDKEFNEKLIRYFDLIKSNDFQLPDRNFFAFKHPFVTITDAFQDACMAISTIPDPEIVEGFYENEIRPLETACIVAFDETDSGDEIKIRLEDMIGRLRNIFGSETQSILKILLKPTAENWKINKPSTFSKFFSVVTHGRVTAFWNNQDGAPSMMTRILGAYARCRSQWLRDNPKRIVEISVVQMKIHMAQVRLFVQYNGMALEDLHEYFRWKILLHTTYRYEIQRDVLDRLKDIEKAPALINRSLSCLQLVAAAVGIYAFANKKAPVARDYVDLTNCISNAGLAFSGVFPKEWARIAGEASVTATGKALTGIGFFCTAYTASIAATDYEMYGEEDLCTLEIVRFFLALSGGSAWVAALMLGTAGAGPVGWIVFLGLLAVDLIQYAVEKRKFGTQNFVKQALQQIEENPVLRENYETAIEVPDRTPGGAIHSAESLVFRYGVSRYRIYYQFNFEGILAESAHLADRWEMLKKHAYLPFRALYPEKTVPVLVQRGWQLNGLIDIHHDGELSNKYGQLQYESNKYSPDLSWTADFVVRKLYREYQNRHSNQDHVQYYASMLRGELI